VFLEVCQTLHLRAVSQVTMCQNLEKKLLAIVSYQHNIVARHQCNGKKFNTKIQAMRYKQSLTFRVFWWTSIFYITFSAEKKLSATVTASNCPDTTSHGHCTISSEEF